MSDYQNVFKVLQQVANVVTNIPKNTGTIFVLTETYFLTPLKGGSAHCYSDQFLLQELRIIYLIY